MSEALVGLLTAVADDELILGHRHSEWTGFATMMRGALDPASSPGIEAPRSRTPSEVVAEAAVR